MRRRHLRHLAVVRAAKLKKRMMINLKMVERESFAQNIEQQQQDIFELLDSDEEDDVIPDNISRENVNPVDKIRRRVFTPDSEAPGELDMQLAATSTLTNNDNDNDSEAPGELDIQLAATTTFNNKVGNSLDFGGRGKHQD